MGRNKRPNAPTNEFEANLILNTHSYRYYFNKLFELAISMFEWKNLPDTVDERFLELALFGDGMAIFFKDGEDDGDLGYLALRTMIGGRLNVYQIPTVRRAYAANGYNKELDENNSVIIFNNLLHTNSAMDISMFANRLYDLDRTIDINASAQKTPILISCKDTQRLTLKNTYKEFIGNAPVIFATDKLDPDSIKVLKTDAPFVADKIYTLKTQIWNEALTYLGISNLNLQKKERLVSDEVTRNLGGTIASRHSRLEARRQACEQINKMFGLNISVDYREDFREADDETMFPGSTGGGGMVDQVVDLRTK
jgi:hypothetical protein